MSETIVLWWLLILTGGVHAPPVYLPAPFQSEQNCVAAGEAFKESKLDRMEAGSFVCLPQPTPSHSIEGER